MHFFAKKHEQTLEKIAHSEKRRKRCLTNGSAFGIIYKLKYIYAECDERIDYAHLQFAHQNKG